MVVVSATFLVSVIKSILLTPLLSSFPLLPKPHWSIFLTSSFRFYDKAHKIDALDFFKQFAVSPDDLPDTVFASIGRTILRDIGPTALGFRFAMKVRIQHIKCLVILFDN